MRRAYWSVTWSVGGSSEVEVWKGGRGARRRGGREKSAPKRARRWALRENQSQEGRQYIPS
eukprot:1016625-Prorocentrum_minimum.AAC.1